MEKQKSKTKPRILLSVISNQSHWPVYFVDTLINLYDNTKKHFPIDLVIVNSCSIENMRNSSAIIALGKNPDKMVYDYFIQLDTDHLYPMDYIIKLMKHNKEFVVGLTNRRKPPYTTTQFKKYKSKNITDPKNTLGNEDIGLVKIESTGVMGALMKTSILKKIKWPFFNDIYFNNDYLKEGIKRRGSDVEFTKKLTKAGVELYCDTSITFPHEVTVHIDRGKIKPYL